MPRSAVPCRGNRRAIAPRVLAAALCLSSVSAAGQEAPSPGAASGASGPVDAAELEAFIDGVMKIQLDDHHTAGAVVTVVRDGAVLFSKGYGYADWEGRTPVDPATTLFRIGSISKLFTWTTVMQLVEEGRLDLDTDVNTYLDGTGVHVPEAFGAPVTLRHLMTHSAGFEDWVVELFGDDAAEDVRPLADILADQMPARVRPPGEVSSYSNHGTGLAALVVETVAGRPWLDVVEERILRPLGMRYATFRQPLPGELEGHMSKGYAWAGGRFVEKDFEIVPLAPVGAGAASGEAMAKFMLAHLALGAPGDARILREETARLMHEPSFRMAPGVNAMALGFYEMSRNGQHIIGHGGDTFWFHSELALFPEHDLGVFVSFNSRAGGAATGQFVEAFVDHYFPVERVEPQPPDDFAERAERFTHRFRSNRFSHTTLGKLSALQTMKVRATDRGTLRAFGSEWVEVAPLTFAERFGPRGLVFREDGSGRITHLFRTDVPVLAFERVPLRENPVLHLWIALAAAAAVLGTLVAWPLGWVLRRWYGVGPDAAPRMPARARLPLWLAALTFAASTVAFAAVLSDPQVVAVQVPAALPWVLAVPLVGILFLVAALYRAVQLRQQGVGSRAGRWAYSFAVLAMALLVWQLHVWNLLGWRY